jgi:nucleotide-binding universal stress UspA family protein
MRRFRRILVPHDHSAPADGALRVAASLLPPGGRLVVLHALSLAPFYPDGHALRLPDAELLASEQRRLARHVARVLGRGRRGVECRVAVGVPSECILRAARDADLVVIGTTGRTGLRRLVIGSVAERVVRHAAAPVLSVRRGAAPRRTRRPAAGRGRRRR